MSLAHAFLHEPYDRLEEKYEALFWEYFDARTPRNKEELKGLLRQQLATILLEFSKVRFEYQIAQVRRIALESRLAFEEQDCSPFQRVYLA